MIGRSTTSFEDRAASEKEAAPLGRPPPACAADDSSRVIGQSDRNHRYDPMVAVNDDDFIADDEVPVSAPFRMNLDENLGYLDHMHVGRNGGADRDVEVDARDTRSTSAHQNRFPDLGALLGRQRHGAASLTSSRLTGLAWLGRLTLLAGLPLLRLRLRLRRCALGLARALIPLALIPLRLTLGLVARGLPACLIALVARALSLTLVFVFVFLALAAALIALTAWRLSVVFQIVFTLRAWLLLALRRLARGLVFLLRSSAALLLRLTLSVLIALAWACFRGRRLGWACLLRWRRGSTA
jgi:hypothetical protein